MVISGSTCWRRIAIMGLALAVATWLSGCGGSQRKSPGAAGGKESVAKAGDAAAFAPLKGRWVRQDGDYMIEIKSVATDGKMEAGYFNPRPIHVGKAEAESREGLVRVYVLLADQGYPGSNYKLRYESGSDTLQGSYHQAASGETFSVIFERLKDQ